MILIKMPFLPSFIMKSDVMKLSHTVRRLYFLFKLALNKPCFVTIRKQDAPCMKIRVQTHAQQKRQQGEQEVQADKFA